VGIILGLQWAGRPVARPLMDWRGVGAMSAGWASFKVKWGFGPLATLRKENLS
jgi:hypothetical protein